MRRPPLRSAGIGFLAALLLASPARAADGAPGPGKPADLPAIGSVDKQVLAAKVLDNVYGPPDTKQGCWVAEVGTSADAGEDGVDYCMKIDRVDEISSVTGRRLYILAAGDADGSPAAATTGLIGAFVLEDHGGHTELIASGRLNAGDSGATRGEALRKWRLVQLGPSDYWGWQNSETDSETGGVIEGRYLVLAPFGKDIRDLAKGLRQSYDDGGTCEEDPKHPHCTAWESRPGFDTGSADSIYPLTIEVSGTFKGQRKAQTYRAPFDRKTWSYLKPRDPLFAD